MTDLPMTFKGGIYPWQLDHMGHLNVQHYVAMFDQSTWGLLSLIGLNAAYFRDNKRGMAALEQHISYRHELYSGDLVENRSGILEVRNKAIRLFHDMRNVERGVTAARAELVVVFMDAESRKGLPLPPDVRERALQMVVTADAG